MNSIELASYTLRSAPTSSLIL